MQTVAVLYLDGDDRKLWEASLDAVPDLLSITVDGNPAVSLEALRRKGGTIRVVIISARLYPGAYPELAKLVREACPGIELLLISPDDASPPLKPLFADDIRHLALNSEKGRPNREHLPSVISMLVDRRAWEIGACLKKGTKVHSYRLGSSEDKESMIGALEGVLAGAGEEMDMLRQKGALLADELLENAMYNAPRGAHGDRLFKKGEKRDMLPQEHIIFSFGFDGETLALKLADNWGSLEPDLVLEYLAKNQEDGSGADDAGGRGLFIIWRFLDQFHVNVEPGRRTVVGGHLQLGSRLDPDAPRGFHITKHQKEIAT